MLANVADHNEIYAARAAEATGEKRLTREK